MIGDNVVALERRMHWRWSCCLRPLSVSALVRAALPDASQLGFEIRFLSSCLAIFDFALDQKQQAGLDAESIFGRVEITPGVEGAVVELVWSPPPSQAAADLFEPVKPRIWRLLTARLAMDKERSRTTDTDRNTDRLARPINSF